MLQKPKYNSREKQRMLSSREITLRVAARAQGHEGRGFALGQIGDVCSLRPDINSSHRVCCSGLGSA